jgi:hypothetical protein
MSYKTHNRSITKRSVLNVIIENIKIRNKKSSKRIIKKE